MAVLRHDGCHHDLGTLGCHAARRHDQPRADDQFQPLRAGCRRGLDPPDRRRDRAARARLRRSAHRAAAWRRADLGYGEAGDGSRPRRRALPQEVRRAAMNDVDRAGDIVAKMSLEDKVALACADFAAVAHLGLPPLSFTDGGNGVRVADDATAFPACVSLAAAFDEQLAYRFGSAVGHQARSAGHNVLLGPALDIARTPLGGRQAEAFGEDPYLTGSLGAAYVRGVQGHVVAMVKHFVVNNFETGRTGSGWPPSDRGPAVDI